MSKHWTILHIREGKIQNPSAVRKLFDELKDGKYLIEINKHNKRSTQQNRYYFGIVVPLVRDGIFNLGTDLTLAETHDFLKAEFNYTEIVSSDGEVKRAPRSTTALSKEQFSEYIQRIQIFSAEFLNIYIPDPNEQLTLDI